MIMSRPTMSITFIDGRVGRDKPANKSVNADRLFRWRSKADRLR